MLSHKQESQLKQKTGPLDDSLPSAKKLLKNTAH